MEEEDVIIIQVIFKFEDGRLYNFDVDRTTTLYETKKILSNAAHILKNSFTLYHEGKEYSKEYDTQPLIKIFPTLKKIEFYLKLRKMGDEQDENEHDQISVKYNIKEPCKEHIGKFLVLYCITCKKSICNECFSISHNNHEVEEKSDYLMPAKILMERIFANSFMYKSDPKLSHYMSCVSFRSIIKTDVFDRMRQLINELENKCINCLEFFSFNEDTTEKNNDLNLELLKKYCTSSFIKLKNNIDTKEILINDEVFLSLYNKLKSIKEYEISIFTENSNKYKALNTFFLPFTQEIKNMSLDLNNILTRYINKDIYAKFKEDISKNIVDVIQKEDVTRFMFENINVPKRKMSGTSLLKPEENSNKNSLTPNITQRLLPSILQLNESKNNINNNINNNISNRVNLNNINFNNNNKYNNANLVNNNINYHQTQYTISNPIYFSHTSNNLNSNTMNNMNMNISNNNSSINNMNLSNKTNAINNMNANLSNNTNNMNNMNMNLSNNSKSINNMNMNLVNSNMNLKLPNNTNTLDNMNISFANNDNINNNNFIISNTNNMNNLNHNLQNNNSMNNLNMNLSNTNINNNIMNKVNTITNINNTNTITSMKSFLFCQNISECIHDFNTVKEEKKIEKKIEKNDRMEVEESGETPPTQNSPNIKNSEINYAQTKIDEIKANLSDKNICSSPAKKKTFINVHLSPPKKDDNLDNKTPILSNNYIQQKGLFFSNISKEKNSLETSNTIKNKMETQTIPKNSINNVSIFNGKLIDVLNNEKNSISNTHNNVKSLNAAEKKEDITLSQKIQNFSAELNSINSNINNVSKSNNNINIEDKTFSQKTEKQQMNNFTTTNSSKNFSFRFMFPVFKSSIAKGALNKSLVREIKINFDEFSKEDPIISEFPLGGAYCNYENSLYFSGGQDYIKEASKLFLSIMKNDLNDYNEKAKKLPLMKNSHWNHSMIADKGKIYVIGGYNSNKCEFYDIANKSWKEMPNLIAKERQRSMLFIEKNFLYCFMGLNQNGILDTVERLNMENIEAGWENIIVDNCDNINLKFYGAGIKKMNQANKIFFIGGKKEKKNKEVVYKRSIYEFSFDDYKMVVSDFKIENDLEFVENKLFSIDENDCGNFINIGNGYLISMPNLVK